jgi:hypothetical protein
LSLSVWALFDGSVPLLLSLGLQTVAVVWAFKWYQPNRSPLLSRLAIVCFALPFVHCVPYLLSSDYPGDRRILWGLVISPYQTDRDLVQRLSAVGAIGTLALASGLAMPLSEVSRQTKSAVERPLGAVGYCFFGLAAIFFSWLAVPQDTIFAAVYSTSVSVLAEWGLNFNGAWMVSYIFMIALFVDARTEPNAEARFWKLLFFSAALAWIVVVMQFLRGDRESVALIIALVCLVLAESRRTEPKGHTRRATTVLVGVILVLAFVGAQLVGAIRVSANANSLSQAITESEFNLDSLLTGTWSSVLMSPLSAVGDLRYGLIEPKYGQTYLDYVASLPPGAVTQALGLQRPIEADRGPAWELTYGYGGLHATVVPLLNFGEMGVTVVLFVYGLLIRRVERLMDVNRARNRLLYGTMLLIVPFWFWYGEMNAVRGLMAFWLIYVIHRALTATGQHDAPAPRHHRELWSH